MGSNMRVLPSPNWDHKKITFPKELCKTIHMDRECNEYIGPFSHELLLLQSHPNWWCPDGWRRNSFPIFLFTATNPFLKKTSCVVFLCSLQRNGQFWDHMHGVILEKWGYVLLFLSGPWTLAIAKSKKGGDFSMNYTLHKQHVSHIDDGAHC